MLRIFLACTRWVLSLRYRLTLHGMEHLEGGDPVVVMPNHPALVDPLLMISTVATRRFLSPIMTETYMGTPGLGPILRGLRTVPVGDLARGGDIDDVRRAFTGIRAALSSGRDLLLYPSGHVYVQPFEHIVGKKMAYEIIGQMPQNTKVILARTRGLWGSEWSKAYTGKLPPLVPLLLRSIGYILANGIFFVPRREVSIEFVDMTTEIKEWYALGLDECNQKLQGWYNAPGNEPCTYIRHYVYHDDTEGRVEPTYIEGSVAELQQGSDIHATIPEEMGSEVIATVARVKKIPGEKLNLTTNLVLDLNCDSLDMAEIKSILQQKYDTATNPPIGHLKTLQDLAFMSLGLLKGDSLLPPQNFSVTSANVMVWKYTRGQSILDHIVTNYRNNEKSPYIYDAMTGMVTRDEFITKAYVVGEYLRKFQAKRIGIMLPALTVTNLLLVGTYLSGKLPVMLNWTVGESSFQHCMQFAGLEYILTSRKFYTKINSPWLAKFESKMIFIEDVIRDLSIFTKIIAVTRKTLSLTPDLPEEAVMLFTSGSESLPKAVVLTHENILSDIEGALSLVPFRENEILLGFLPPFHSFGFTINTIFPLVAPLQVVYTPDPGDSRAIGRILAHTRANIISTTPTFLRMILANSTSEMLGSLRSVFVGAEKCGDDIFEQFHEKCPQAVILEGYGITECSPIVTVNPLSHQKRGSVGRFLPQVHVTIRDIDTMQDLAVGNQGMIFVSGSSVFEGYSDTKIESPFVDIDGRPWYKTGDLGYIDNDGFLFITGRLKRFVKIAGEMISLPAMESILLKEYGSPDLIRLAIEAREDTTGVTIVAFTTFDTTIESLNETLRNGGIAAIAKISNIKKIDTIPVLGTGKVDYKQLKSMI